MFFAWKYFKIIFFIFLKFIFDISKSKLSENTNKKQKKKIEAQKN
jgi:uncharacterized membrane protein